MRSPTCILAVALGLLSSPTVASKCDNVAIERLPVFATSDGPFILRAQEGFNVVVKYHAEHKTFIPVLTKSNHLPEFLLTHGNITSADGSIAGFYPPSPAIFPPVLLPLLFGKEVGSKNGADLVAVTRTRSDGSGRSVLRIFPLDGPPVVKSLSEGAPIYVKPDGNQESTILLELDIRRPPGYQKDCVDNQKYVNNNWDLK